MLVDLLEKRVAPAGGVAAGALPSSPVQYCILAAGTAVAWVYAIEINITIFLIFKRRNGLYFWSLLLCSWGITLHALGFILKFLVGANWILACTIIDLGWVPMVTGQAFVLYSRLHLIVRNQRTLRLVLGMVLFNAAALHIPTTITFFGANSPQSAVWIDKFNVVERVQLAGFCVQEFIIGTIYLYSTTRLLGATYHNLSKKVMTELIIINCICIGMDIVLICLEYTNQYIGEASMKPMIYAIKLKLEFTVLNQLKGLAKSSLTEGHRWEGGQNNELKDRYAFNDLERKSKLGTQTSARAVRYSTGPRPDGPYPEPNGILRVQHTEIFSEPASRTIPEEQSTPPVVATAFPDRDQVPNSTGKTQVRIPGRSNMNSRSDYLERKHSPSKSQMEIIRNSSDTEKGIQ